MIASDILEAAGNEDPVGMVVQALRDLNNSQRESVVQAMETYIKVGTYEALGKVWEALESAFPILTSDPKEFSLEDPNRYFEGYWKKVVSDLAKWKQVLSMIGDNEI